VLGTVAIIEPSAHWRAWQTRAYAFVRKLERECAAVGNQQFKGHLRPLAAALNRNIGEKRIDNLLHLVHAQVVAVYANAAANPSLAQAAFKQGVHKRNGLGSFAVGAVAGCGEQDPESVMIKVFESVGEPADLLDDQVDGFSAAVGDPLVSK
jgi:hypothetical protein